MICCAHDMREKMLAAIFSESKNKESSLNKDLSMISEVILKSAEAGKAFCEIREDIIKENLEKIKTILVMHKYSVSQSSRINEDKAIEISLLIRWYN